MLIVFLFGGMVCCQLRFNCGSERVNCIFIWWHGMLLTEV